MTRRRGNKSFKYILMTILVGALLLIVLFSYTVKSGRKLSFIGATIKDSVVQVQKIVYYPFESIIGIIEDYNNLKDVQKENDILKSKIEEIEYLETENIELKQQLKELKEELSIDYSLVDYEYLNATVVTRNTNYWYNNLTIDKGTHNGVDVGMVVISSYGLIGKVISVTTFTAEVRLLTTSDTNNKISVSISDGTNKINGLINGYDYKENILEVEGISNTESVNVGDVVYTSGLGGVFPSGILIGKVESITTDVYGLAKIINVVPSANFDNLNYVTVLKRKEQ